MPPGDRPLLLAPGPVEVHPDAAAAAALPMVHHRGAAFRAVLDGLGVALPRLARADGGVALHAGSGTLAMEAAVANLCRPGDRVVVCQTGLFGRRFAELARAVGALPEVVTAPPGEPVGEAALAAALAAGPPPVAVLLQHVDTSTGVRNDVAALAPAARAAGALVVVDAIASLGTDPLHAAAWGVDVVVGASQKGLMAPPGLGLAVIAPRAREAAARPGGHTYYTSWTRRPWDRVLAPFTAAVPVVRAVAAGVEVVEAHGIERVWERQRRDAEATRAGLAALGFHPVAAEGARAAFVSVLAPPPGLDAAALAAALEARGAVAARGPGVLRLGHYGLNRVVEPPEVVELVGGAAAALGAAGPDAVRDAAAVAARLA